jgi:hypothetical protein
MWWLQTLKLVPGIERHLFLHFNKFCRISKRLNCFRVTVTLNFITVFPRFVLIPVAARSKAWVCGRSLAGIAGSNPPPPQGAWQSLSCECCVLSGRGLCDGPITRLEESYRMWCIWVWSRNLRIRRPRPTRGCRAMKKNLSVYEPNSFLENSW